MRATGWAISMLVGLTVGTPASAQTPIMPNPPQAFLEPEQALRRYLPQVGEVDGFTAMWIDAMPRVAQVCNMRLNKAQFSNVYRSFRGDPDQVRYILGGFDRDPQKNLIWKALTDLEAEGVYTKACALADRLWGENGRMFPGVLVSRDSP